MRLPPAVVGPKVDVTVPLEAPVRFTTCHGAVHDEDGRAPVLLQTEGRYEIRGSVFSIMETIERRDGGDTGKRGCVVMRCRERAKWKE